MSALRFLNDDARCANLSHNLAVACSMGITPEIVLGADRLIFHGDRDREAERIRCDLEREAVLLCGAAIERDQRTPDELLAGVPYRVRRLDGEEGVVIVREAPLEEAACAYANRMRTSVGTQLRRSQANQVADLLMALAERSRQSMRRAAR